jgi:hypothetical protein
MTPILRAVLKDDTIHVYVYSPDDTLNAKVGKEVAHILGPEAATIFWRLQELGDAVIPNHDELNLIHLAVDDEGLIAVDACAALRESTVAEVVETGIRALGGDEAVHESFDGMNFPVGTTIH